MVEIKNILKRVIPAGKAEEVRIKRLDVSPSSMGLYIDTDGVAITPYSNTIEKKDFKWVRESYSVVVPGLMEWYERYLQYVSNPNADFDWKGWHRDGLLFTKQIYFSLPRCIPVRYIIPAEDNSNTLESFDVTEERVDTLLAVLGDFSADRAPVTSDHVVTCVKEEDGEAVIRLNVKDKYECCTFYIEYPALRLLRDFLEKIALSQQEAIPWESQEYEYGLYFYPQQIGGLNHMGQLHIFSKRELIFSAYVNSRQFVSSVYRSVMAHLGSLADNTAYKSFQSYVLECYTDDERYERISYFRKSPKLVNFIGPAIENVRKHFHDMYDSIYDENE